VGTLLNIYCWKCGTAVSEEDVLGIGHFDADIGKFKSKGFIAFKCPKCKKVRYQLLEHDMLSIKNKISRKNNFNFNNNNKLIQHNDSIDIDQVIDFYKILNNIESIDSFLNKCNTSTELVPPDIDKPITQPVDVYNIFTDFNKTNYKRLMILILDQDNYLITWEFMGEGTNKNISFDPKNIFHLPFLLNDKVSIIIAENIKNKYLQPTQKEILITKRLIKTGKILGIEFLDHIIIDENAYHSYDEMNLI